MGSNCDGQCKFDHVVPPIDMSETLGTGFPEASYEEAMGPAL